MKTVGRALSPCFIAHLHDVPELTFCPSAVITCQPHTSLTGTSSSISCTYIFEFFFQTSQTCNCLGWLSGGGDDPYDNPGLLSDSVWLLSMERQAGTAVSCGGKLTDKINFPTLLSVEQIQTDGSLSVSLLVAVDLNKLRRKTRGRWIESFWDAALPYFIVQWNNK